MYGLNVARSKTSHKTCTKTLGATLSYSVILTKALQECLTGFPLICLCNFGSDCHGARAGAFQS